jgi:predicted amidophosphoribosyltransferase
VKALKGGRHRPAFEELAAQFVTELMAAKHRLTVLMSAREAPKIVIVPAPARHVLGWDHAAAWAEALSEQLNRETRYERSVATGLRAPRAVVCYTLAQSGRSNERRSQKSQNQAVRARLSFLRHERASLCFDAHGDACAKWVVFVDDVVTSGATARAAYRALGRPERFAVCTLFCRPPLATLR